MRVCVCLCEVDHNVCCNEGLEDRVNISVFELLDILVN